MDAQEPITTLQREEPRYPTKGFEKVRIPLTVTVIALIAASCGQDTPPEADQAATVGPASSDTPTAPAPTVALTTTNEPVSDNASTTSTPTTAASAVVAVAQGTPIRAIPPEPSPDGFPPATDGAALEGTLVVVDNCFAINWGGETPTPVIWPHDTTYEADVFTTPRTSFAVGDEMFLGGGSTPALDKAVLPELMDEAERCAQLAGGQLFNAGSVNRAEDINL